MTNFTQNVSLTSFILEFNNPLNPALCIATHSPLVKMTALPSFCSAASPSSFLPARICRIWLPAPHLFFPRVYYFLVFVSQCFSQPHFWQGNRHSKKELSLMRSGTKTLTRKLQTRRSLYLCLYLLVIASSHCLRGRSMWLWRAAKLNHYAAVFFLLFLTVLLPPSPLCGCQLL